MTDRRRFTGTCKNEHERLVAYLWEVGDWLPTHMLRSVNTPYGFIGSAGDVRIRELARNDCPEKLRGKIERKKGSEIGRDRRYEYFRYNYKSSTNV